MVRRRSSKIDRSMEEEPSGEIYYPKSPTPMRPKTMRDKENRSTRRLSGLSHPDLDQERSEDRSPTRRSSRSRSRRGMRNLTSTPVTVAMSSGTSETSSPVPTLPLRDVPSGWTTASGNFDPNESMLGFDAKSNIGLHGAVLNSGTETLPTEANDEESTQCSPSSFDVPDNFAVQTSNSIEEEIQDPVERNRFYKNLKKSGIRKHLNFDNNWETDSDRTAISEMSISNASYILDLAQQKESRDRDREEEALEEALELYGTWLTEGKCDDKNIFLMILHEVKKEIQRKYADSDKKQDDFLSAALDEEIERRERIKKEEEEAKNSVQEFENKSQSSKPDDKPEEEPLSVHRTPDPASLRISHHSQASKISNHTKKSVRRITQIIEHNTSQRNLDPDALNSNKVIEESEVCEELETEIHDAPEEWNEPYTVSEQESNKPKQKKRGMFRRIGSTRRVTKNEEGDPVPSSEDSHRAQSRHMFSILRRRLSEKRDKERKEEEKFWKKNDQVETKEEQWWKKINEAEKESSLFDSQRKLHIENPGSVTKGVSEVLSTNLNIEEGHLSGTEVSDVQSVDKNETPQESILSRDATPELVGVEKKRKERSPKRKGSKHGRRRGSIEIDPPISTAGLNSDLDQHDRNSKVNEVLLSPTKSGKKKKKKKSTDGTSEEKKHRSSERKKKIQDSSKKEDGDTPKKGSSSDTYSDDDHQTPDVDEGSKILRSKDKKKKKKSKPKSDVEENEDLPPDSFRAIKKKRDKLIEKSTSCRVLDVTYHPESNTPKTSKKKKNKSLTDVAMIAPPLDDAILRETKVKKKKSKTSTTEDSEFKEKATDKPSKKKKKSKSEERSVSPTLSDEAFLEDLRTSNQSVGDDLTFHD